jgi:hypothetical protein
MGALGEKYGDFMKKRLVFFSVIFVAVLVAAFFLIKLRYVDNASLTSLLSQASSAYGGSTPSQERTLFEPTTATTSAKSLSEASSVVAPASSAKVSGLDLYAQAVHAQSSRDSKALVSALEATSVCEMVSINFDGFTALGQAGAAPDAQPSAAAARELMQRCKGFLNNDQRANLDLRKNIVANIRLVDAYVPSATNRSITEKEVRDGILSKDSEILEKSLFYFKNQFLSAQNLGSESKDAGFYLAAITLVKCDLGYDCSTGNINYLLGCAMRRQCADSFEEVLLTGASQADRDKILGFRKAIASAVERRDLSFFGFSK